MGSKKSKLRLLSQLRDIYDYVDQQRQEELSWAEVINTELRNSGANLTPAAAWPFPTGSSETSFRDTSEVAAKRLEYRRLNSQALKLEYRRLNSQALKLGTVKIRLHDALSLLSDWEDK